MKKKRLFQCLYLCAMMVTFSQVFACPESCGTSDTAHRSFRRNVIIKKILENFQELRLRNPVSIADLYTTFTGTVIAGTSLFSNSSFSDFTSDYSFDQTTGQLTVGSSGFYEVTFGASSTSSASIAVTVNGSIIASAPPIYVDGANSQSMASACFTLDLSAGDILTLAPLAPIDLVSNGTSASAFLQVVQLND